MLTVLSVEEAQQKVVELTEPLTKSEYVSLLNATGRALAADVKSSEAVPSFNRATMDGFAVRAEDTFGATESMPSLLKVRGEVLMGREPGFKLKSGEAAKIPTGGMLPSDSDAVVMLEFVDTLDKDTIAVYHAVGPFENVLKEGEDFLKGEIILQAGHLLRPQDIGVLAALGISEIEVKCRPRVALISSGDEIISPNETPAIGQIRDINTYAVGSQICQLGGEVFPYGIVKDCAFELRSSLEGALANNDVVIISGGSSVGTRDLTSRVIDELGNPGIIFHGVSMRPGKPLIFGLKGKKLIFGLSGNPVSAMVGFKYFVIPVLRCLQGLPPFERFSPFVQGCLSRNLPSASGREDFIRVALRREQDIIWVDPLFGQAGLINTMVKADGLIRIPRDVEGINKGEKVEVFLF